MLRLHHILYWKSVCNSVHMFHSCPWTELCVSAGQREHKCKLLAEQESASSSCFVTATAVVFGGTAAAVAVSQRILRKEYQRQITEKKHSFTCLFFSLNCLCLWGKNTHGIQLTQEDLFAHLFWDIELSNPFKMVEFCHLLWYLNHPEATNIRYVDQYECHWSKPWQGKNLGRCWCCTILLPLLLPSRLIRQNKTGICPTFLSHRSSCTHSKTPK